MMEALGVKKITIDLPFKLDHVNCYLADGEDGWSILDTGINSRKTREVWDELLVNKEINNIYVSHYHPDHFGYAGTLQHKTGATVWMTEIDKKNGLEVWTIQFINQLKDHYLQCGISNALAYKMISNTESFTEQVTPYPIVEKYFVEGLKVPFGKYEYEVIETPGHSEGMICLYNEEKSVMFSCDHILPEITPNISYWFHGCTDPLSQYIDSLNKIKRLDVQYVIPSHGSPFHSANKRIDEILYHHELRLEEILSLIKEPATIYEVCQNLFDQSLTIHELRFAIGEVYAHLLHLLYKGECTKNYKENMIFFEQK